MTNTQKQCLLTFLGYDTGGIGNGWGSKSRDAVEQAQEDLGLEPDGAWGPQTEAAVLEAVYTYDDAPVAEDPADAEITGDPEQDARLAELFKGIRFISPGETRCRCGGKYCNGFPVIPNRVTLELADDLRERGGGPLYISSFIRCRQHNANQPGSAVNSKHLYGKALDFFIEGLSGQQLLALAQADPRTNYAYIIGNGPYVHVDVK